MNSTEECTFAVCGPVDAGKSSLIGVLTSGELDNGRGHARNKILKHPHEIESGRTSNITFNPLIYKKNEKGINLLSVKPTLIAVAFILSLYMSKFLLASWPIK